MKIIISASAPIGGSNYLPPYLWWRRGAMRPRAHPARAGAFPRRLRVLAASGGPLTVKVEVPAGFSGPPGRLMGGRRPRLS